MEEDMFAVKNVRFYLNNHSEIPEDEKQKIMVRAREEAFLFGVPDGVDVDELGLFIDVSVEIIFLDAHATFFRIEFADSRHQDIFTDVATRRGFPNPTITVSKRVPPAIS